MTDYSANSKRLVKNTLVLYVRMLVMMVITLYTSRVVLNALGVEDYGIYNLVGGVVSLFSAVSTTLNVAINRFITYELGKGDHLLPLLKLSHRPEDDFDELTLADLVHLLYRDKR